MKKIVVNYEDFTNGFFKFEKGLIYLQNGNPCLVLNDFDLSDLFDSIDYELERELKKEYFKDKVAVLSLMDSQIWFVERPDEDNGFEALDMDFCSPSQYNWLLEDTEVSKPVPWEWDVYRCTYNYNLSSLEDDLMEIAMSWANEDELASDFPNQIENFFWQRDAEIDEETLDAWFI